MCRYMGVHITGKKMDEGLRILRFSRNSAWTELCNLFCHSDFGHCCGLRQRPAREGGWFGS